MTGVAQILANHQLQQQAQMINLPSNRGTGNKTQLEPSSATSGPRYNINNNINININNGGNGATSVQDIENSLNLVQKFNQFSEINSPVSSQYQPSSLMATQGEKGRLSRPVSSKRRGKKNSSKGAKEMQDILGNTSEVLPF